MRSAKRRSALPGFGLTLGFTISYTIALIILPLSTVIYNLSLHKLLAVLAEPRVMAAIKLSFSAAFIAALFNVLTGPIVAWVLVKYRFPFKNLVDALIDLPFALPTAVAGISLTTLYAPNGWIGGFLESVGIKAAYAPLGIYIALVFVSFPFVVRTLQPIIESLDTDIDSAAKSLGATWWQNVMYVIIPLLLPGCITGFLLAFARALGEYGSVVFISGNIPNSTEIVPFLIMTRLEEFDYDGARALAFVMLILSFSLMLAGNAIEAWMRKRLGQV